MNNNPKIPKSPNPQIRNNDPNGRGTPRPYKLNH